jgi:hypothetical protein
MKFYCGHTNAGNIAVHEPSPDTVWTKYVLVLKTGQWVVGANFPGEICKAEVEAVNACAAAELFAGEKFNSSIGEEEGWKLQCRSESLRWRRLPEAMAARYKAEAEALTIGQLRARLTHRQFCNVLEAARRGNNCARHADPFLAAALGEKLAVAIRLKRKRRDKFGRGSRREAQISASEFWCFNLTEAQCKSPLARFYLQLAKNKKAVAEKKAAALAKRRAPTIALALHIARQMHRHKPGFGRRGDGLVYGHGHGNTGSKRRGGPGTRCAAGVTYAKGKLTFHPTHNGKQFSIPAPPMALRKNARPGIAHPDGLFCRASAEFPGVDENWDYGRARLPDTVDGRLSKPDPKKFKWFLVGWSIRGVRIGERVARRDYALDEALAEPNAEVRRVMLERLPAEAVADKLKLIHSDDFGSLYCEDDSNWRNPDALAFVKVVNSTPEPDGSFKDYFLRVPGDMRRAKQAVAWTFGLTEEQYQPIAQS